MSSNTFSVLEKISKSGVAIWLDDLSRDRIQNGELANLISTKNVVGVTTNPSIFSNAISKSDKYDSDIKKFGTKTIDEIIQQLTTDDVRAACDLFKDVFAKTKGRDGRVSIEVDPRFAMDTKKTVAQAKELWQIINRPNLFIKIPATKPGLSAISEVIAAGISVNVTLIFSPIRYREVFDAYQAGLEQRVKNGLPINEIQSVASIFVSRIDTEVDKRLTDNSELSQFKGKAAIANSIMCYEDFVEMTSLTRWKALAEKGAQVQRPLWASTGVKDPSYDQTMYVTQLVAADTVNTMPEATLNAVIAQGKCDGDSISANFKNARSQIAKLAMSGIDFESIFNFLEADGVKKFETSWNDLIATVSNKLKNSSINS